MAEADTLKKEPEAKPLPQKIRFGWLDQFRGLVILLFIVQTVAWASIGETGFPVLAPHLNHGYKYASVDGWPPIITLIDMGQQIFLFMVGFMAAFSVLKLRQKGKSEGRIWLRIVRRLLSILVLNFVHVSFDGVDFSDIGYVYSVAFDSTLGMIAWSGFLASVATVFISNADIKFILGCGFWAVQLILHFQIQMGIIAEMNGRWFEILAHVGIALIAASFTSWMLRGDGSVDESSFKKRILPVTFSMFLVMYLVEFVQWADHHGATIPVAAMAVGLSGIAVFIFYYMEKNNYKIALLTPLGKNMLLIFLLEMVVVELIYMDMFMLDFIKDNLTNYWLHMVLAGIVPIAILWVIAKILEKLGWHLRV